MFRFTKVLALSVVLLALSFGSANAFDWDAPRLDVNHVTRASIVNGVTDYEPTAEGASRPSHYYTYINLTNIPSNQSGTVWLDLGDVTDVDFYKGGIEYIKSESYPAGFTTFYAWEYLTDPTNYYAGGINGEQADFVGNSEKTLSERDFGFTIDTISVNGMTGKIRTTEEQMANNCVPYMEFVSDNSTLTSIKWKFVAPLTPSTTLYRNEQNDIIRIQHIRIYTFDGNFYHYDLGLAINTNEMLAGEVALRQAIPLENIRFAQLGFYFSDRLSESCQTEHQWRFYPVVIDTPGPEPTDPTQPNPDKPSTEDIENAASAANINLIQIPTEFTAAETTNITTGTKVTFGNSEVKSRTSSVIAVNQNVAEGGAVVLGTSMNLPLNSQSLSGAELPKPTDFNDLTDKYQVLKYFENGGSIDLLSTFGGKIFSYSTETGVTMNTTIIVIDGPVPDSEQKDVFSPPFGEGKYGVKLSLNNQYLYVYDGIRDKLASDPIALVQVEDDGGNDDDDNNNGGGGSNGCNTGLFAILGLVAVPLVLRKK